MRLNFKRLGLLGAHVARAIAREVELTSARFDLMSLLIERPRMQRSLAAMLCVSEPVVSRLVTALEASGQVMRLIPPWDRRLRIVALTEEGRERIAMMADDGELRMPSDGRESAQCTGELYWLDHWEDVLERLGLGTLISTIGTQSYEISEPVPPPPPFRAMQHRALRRTYMHFESFLLTWPVRAERPWRIDGYEPPTPERAISMWQREPHAYVRRPEVLRSE